MPVVISFSGAAQHGKTTAAEYTKDFFERNGKKVCLINYADYLKFIAGRYFRWDGKKDVAGRTLLQTLGTEKVRSKHPDFWVDTVIDLIKALDDEFDFVVISDTRFPNEISRWKEEGFEILTVLVRRLNYDNGLTDEQKNHPSETALDNYEDWDFVIEVESGVPFLQAAVFDFLECAVLPWEQ